MSLLTIVQEYLHVPTFRKKGLIITINRDEVFKFKIFGNTYNFLAYLVSEMEKFNLATGTLYI